MVSSTINPRKKGKNKTCEFGSTLMNYSCVRRIILRLI